MLDLDPYQEVSAMPAVKRDLSLVLGEDMDAEAIGDQVREALGEQSKLIEDLEILAESSYSELPTHVQIRLGMEQDQKNVLLRVVLKALDRTLTDEACNELRDRVYASLHQGKNWEWASDWGESQARS